MLLAPSRSVEPAERLQAAKQSSRFFPSLPLLMPFSSPAVRSGRLSIPFPSSPLPLSRHPPRPLRLQPTRHPRLASSPSSPTPRLIPLRPCRRSSSPTPSLRPQPTRRPRLASSSSPPTPHLIPLRPYRRSSSPAPSLCLTLRPHRHVAVLALGSTFDVFVGFGVSWFLQRKSSGCRFWPRLRPRMTASCSAPTSPSPAPLRSTLSSSRRGGSTRLFGAPAPSSPKSSGYATSGPPFATPPKNAGNPLRGYQPPWGEDHIQ